jgi:hypothetical protein
MISKRQRFIRDFVTGRADDIEKETGQPATPAQLREAHDEAEGRVDNYLRAGLAKTDRTPS